MTNVQQTDLVPRGETLLLAARDPADLVKKATALANVLQKVITDGKLFTMIGQKKHVQVEGWTTLGAMIGVFPIIEHTREIVGPDGDYLGWEARCTVQRPDGAVIGAAEAECRTAEKRWASADSYAVRSMAQTRATSKAMRLPLAWVMTLAGFDATPAEEMSGSGRTNGPAQRQQDASSRPATVEPRSDEPPPPTGRAKASKPVEGGGGVLDTQCAAIYTLLGRVYPKDEQSQFEYVERVQPKAVSGIKVALTPLTFEEGSEMIKELQAIAG